MYGLISTVACLHNPFLKLMNDSCTNHGVVLQAGGVAVILGLMDSTKRLSFHPSKLLWGKIWTSGLFGGFKGRSDLPGLVDKCTDGVCAYYSPGLLLSCD